VFHHGYFAMNNYLLIPLAFIKFWYFDAPLGMLGFFISLNSAFFQLFSLPLFLRTFFKPLKNEYRQGLVHFSIAMGIVIKSIFIIVDLLLFVVIVFCELSVLLSFLLLPMATLFLLFFT
jgi:hypothetical protein